MRKDFAERRQVIVVSQSVKRGRCCRQDVMSDHHRLAEVDGRSLTIVGSVAVSVAGVTIPAISTVSARVSQAVSTIAIATIIATNGLRSRDGDDGDQSQDKDEGDGVHVCCGVGWDCICHIRAETKTENDLAISVGLSSKV